jgi:hypothetical protein
VTFLAAFLSGASAGLGFVAVIALSVLIVLHVFNVWFGPKPAASWWGRLFKG